VREKILQQLEAAGQVVRHLPDVCIDDITRAAELLVQTVTSGGKVILFGNGGSASDADHIAAELIGRFQRQRRGLPAISLASNVPALTAISNDFGYETGFARQVEAFAAEGDTVVALSTSGRSANVIAGVQAAHRLGLKAIALTGSPGEPLAGATDVAIRVPSSVTPRIQECHILIGHILCEMIDETVAAREPRSSVDHQTDS
jgi:D-sedoheptulose 7-phosphate isomerase